VLKYDPTSEFFLTLAFDHDDEKIGKQLLAACGIAVNKKHRIRKGNKRIKTQVMHQHMTSISAVQCNRLMDEGLVNTAIYERLGLYPALWPEDDDQKTAHMLTQPTKHTSYAEGCVCRLRIHVEHAPIFVRGHYCKFDRELSQTPWIVDGVRLAETSIQEEIEKTVLPHYGVNAVARFHSSGREDRDVRMLGRGREFFLEILQITQRPREHAAYKAMQDQVNRICEGKVTIRGLHLSQKKQFDVMNKGIADKRKTYRCICHSSRVLKEGELKAKLDQANVPIKLAQKTPIRVLHRRVVMTRTRNIYNISTLQLNNHWFIMDLETQSGTYVKEFVHGDRGRTTPNVAMLLGDTNAKILQLDVQSLVGN
jgi:tRNA pseudouridine synthase 10